MSEAVTLWILGTIVTVLILAIGALGKALWEHVQHCKDVSSKLAEIGADVKRIQVDVGDHDHGLRRDIRKHTEALFKLDARVETLEREDDER